MKRYEYINQKPKYDYEELRYREYKAMVRGQELQNHLMIAVRVAVYSLAGVMIADIIKAIMK